MTLCGCRKRQNSQDLTLGHKDHKVHWGGRRTTAALSNGHSERASTSSLTVVPLSDRPTPAPPAALWHTSSQNCARASSYIISSHHITGHFQSDPQRSHTSSSPSSIVVASLTIVVVATIAVPRTVTLVAVLLGGADVAAGAGIAVLATPSLLRVLAEVRAAVRMVQGTHAGAIVGQTEELSDHRGSWRWRGKQRLVADAVVAGHAACFLAHHLGRGRSRDVD
mmetsp:Transcript_68217/g.148842  ORF Transcript_68217/g.148842 Transcript_68217/m.148842 type:complete len:223 (-) Transcript_68217:630-1298(-)